MATWMDRLIARSSCQGDTIMSGNNNITKGTKIRAVLLFFCLAFISCLNPIGFMPDTQGPGDGGSGPEVPGAQKPGETSPIDDPNLHPDPDKGILIFKNLSGGDKALAATFTVTGQEHDINQDLLVGSGGEQSITLLPGTYNIVITFDGAGSPVSGSKVLLPGWVEYIYFYVDRNGNYKGGINVDSSYVYGDINYNYYADNENENDNEDGDHIGRPEEGDVSRDNDPRTKLPSGMRENYGIVIVHNLSRSMDLKKLLFDHHAASGTFDVHWEMNPGPDQGNKKSIILRTGHWQIRGMWMHPAGFLDPADPGDLPPAETRAVISNFKVEKSGASNYINDVYFYKNKNDSKWHLTADISEVENEIDVGDWQDNPSGGDTGGTTPGAEGDYSSENGNIDIGNTWWNESIPPNRSVYGVVRLQNLSSKVRISGITFTRSGKSPLTMPSIGPRNYREIILEKGQWNVEITYTDPLTAAAQSRTGVKNVQSLGLGLFINHLYFYYYGSDYHIETDDSPPAYENDNPSYTGSPGENEGDSPGALTDLNRNTLGLLILKNLSPDTSVERAHFSYPAGLAPVKSFDMIPGPQQKDQRSILLGSGDWQVTASYYNDQGTLININTPKTIHLQAGTVSYMYFYKSSTGYSLSPTWPPMPNDAVGDNEDPDNIIGENEGWLNVINKSAISTIDRVQYNNNGTWIDVEIPNATTSIAPGDESDPDLVVPKGSWSFRFKVANKQTYSRSVSGTIQAGQTRNITYTDALDSDLPPAGMGTLRVVNNTTDMIIRMLTKSVTTQNEQNIWDNTAVPDRPGLGFEISGDFTTYFYNNFTLGAKGTADSTGVQVMDSGGIGMSKAYIVQAYISNTSFYEASVLIEDGKIDTLMIEPDTTHVVTNPDDSNPGSSIGGLRIYNAYSGMLPFKIYKIVLYERVRVQTGFVPGAETYEDQHRNGYEDLQRANGPDQAPTNSGPQSTSKSQWSRDPIPDSATHYHNGGLSPALLSWNVVATFDPNTYLRKGEYVDLSGLEEGYYKLLVVGGSYAWEYYASTNLSVINNVVDGILIDEARITYDMGDIFLTRNTQKIINFNPYVPGVNDRDTPRGYVTVDFMHAGSVSGTSGNIVRTQFASQQWVGPGSVDSNTGIQGQTSTRNVDESIPRRHLVYSYDNVIHPGDSATTFLLPPAKYGMRVYDAPLADWFGRNSSHYLDLDLSLMGGKRILVTWYYPNLRLQSDMESQTWYAIDDTNLTAYFNPPKAGENPVLAIDAAQYYAGKGNITWYVSNNGSNGVPENPQLYGRYKHNLSFADTTTWTGLGGNATGNSNANASYFAPLVSYIDARQDVLRVDPSQGRDPHDPTHPDLPITLENYRFESGLIYVARLEMTANSPYTFSEAGKAPAWQYDTSALPGYPNHGIFYDTTTWPDAYTDGTATGNTSTPSNARGRMKISSAERSAGVVWLGFPRCP
jgi:hypothetical protein